MSKYLKMRAPYIGIWLIFEAAMLSVFSLYDINLTPFLHLSIIFLLLIVILLIWDFFRLKKKHDLLKDNHWNDIEPSDFIEEDYLEIIEMINRENRITKDKAAGDYNDMIEYFTVWAHQIKTPISALSLTVQNIDDDSLRRTLQSELVRTEEYTDMVMGYLRLQDDSSDYVFENINLSDVIRPEIRRMKTLFMSKKIMPDYDGSDAVVLSDKRWLGFCLGQILTNSIKYSNGGKITIRAEQNKITISDEGIGIAPEDLPRIFEKGYTGYNGRSDKKSTGIGLYLVKKAMTSIGGDIVIESVLGKGTTVSLIIKKE